MTEGIEILHIGKKRKRDVYYHKEADGTVRVTRPLPSDDIGRMQYEAKGFSLTPPGEKTKSKPADGLECPMCDFVAKSAFGFQAHFKSHLKTEEPE